jgi:hypothetical protein
MFGIVLTSYLRLYLTLYLTWGLAIAGTPAIGTVTASGAFRLNGDTVLANGTLTEGAVLETGRGNSSVRLTGGARLSLSADSRGKLYSDRIILEKGETRLIETYVDNGAGFYLEALGLTIHPNPGTSTGRVGLLGGNRVRVAAQTGSFRVLNGRGVLVANVAAGSALAFEPLVSVSAAATHIMGTLTRQSGHFLLTDQVTHVVLEVTGQSLAPNVGRVVQVTGMLNGAATPIAGASQVIAATSVQSATVSAALVGATRGGAAAAGTGGASAGAGIGVASITVVGGVAATMTSGGLAASGALPGSSQSTPLGVPAARPVTAPGQPPGRPPVTPPVTPPGQPPGRPPVSPPGLSR